MPKAPISDLENWKPKTKLGRLVKEGKIKSIDEILEKGLRILEPEIVDWLLGDALEYEMILIGQKPSKAQGKRIPYRITRKKTSEGAKTTFSAMVIVGNKDGYIGLGVGRAPDKGPAREKAIRNAKLNLMKIKRGCGSWECACGEPHSIPFRVEGKVGSVRVILMPAPRGAGLIAHTEIQKVLRLAGVRDVWSKTFGKTKTTVNLIYAAWEALRKLNEYKIQERFYRFAGIVEGPL